MAPHSSTLAWKIPWTEEPGRLQSMGSRRVRHDWATSLSIFTFIHWRRKWQPTPVFLPGESQGRGSLVSCRLWGHTESNTTEATEHGWSSTMTARLQPHVALAPTPGAPPLIRSFVLQPEGLIRPKAATRDHRLGSAAQLLLLPIPLCPHLVLMISFTEWREVPSKTFLFLKLVWKILYVGLLTTMSHLINLYNPLLQRLERQTLSFPTSLVSNGSHRHSSGWRKARPHSEVCGCKGGRRGLGKMISCYSASWYLALNFDVMAEDRVAFLQLLNSKIKNHMPRRADWENRNSFKIIKFLRNGNDIDPGIKPRFPALQADSLPSGKTLPSGKPRGIVAIFLEVLIL